MNSNDGKNKRYRSIWAGLFVYAVSGWFVVEILLAVRERFELNEMVEPVVLGLFIAGFVATALMVGLRRRHKQSSLVQSLLILGVVALCSILALGIFRWLQPPVSLESAASIAILPCDYEGDPEYQYLAYAFAEEVNKRLGLQSELQVPGWRAILQVHEISPDPNVVAGQLGVEKLATCRIERSEESTLIEATVLQLRQARPILKQRYEVTTGSLANTVIELAVALVERVVPRVMVDDRLMKLPTANPDAYELFLKAGLLAFLPEYQGRFLDANDRAKLPRPGFTGPGGGVGETLEWE